MGTLNEQLKRVIIVRACGRTQVMVGWGMSLLIARWRRCILEHISDFVSLAHLVQLLGEALHQTRLSAHAVGRAWQCGQKGASAQCMSSKETSHGWQCVLHAIAASVRGMNAIFTVTQPPFIAAVTTTVTTHVQPCNRPPTRLMQCGGACRAGSGAGLCFVQVDDPIWI